MKVEIIGASARETGGSRGRFTGSTYGLRFRGVVNARINGVPFRSLGCDHKHLKEERARECAEKIARDIQGGKEDQ